MSIQPEKSSFIAASESLGSIDSASSRTSPSRSLENIATKVGMFLLCGLFRQIIGKGALTVIAPDGCSHNIGSGLPSVAIRVTDPTVIPQLLLNPDLASAKPTWLVRSS